MVRSLFDTYIIAFLGWKSPHIGIRVTVKYPTGTFIKMYTNWKFYRVENINYEYTNLITYHAIISSFLFLITPYLIYNLQLYYLIWLRHQRRTKTYFWNMRRLFCYHLGLWTYELFYGNECNLLWKKTNTCIKKTKEFSLECIQSVINYTTLWK